ncbi:MAG TPA: histidine phosphatase family protein [Acidimicrobiales bacterium]|nr:histidine phosphatase family protein [Acidimicrobiales bacterium]
MAALVLVRHGQTAANAAGLLLGRSDPPLTELGRLQAAACGQALKAAGPGAWRLVSSPLRRAVETAGLLGVGPEVEVDQRWVELDYGEAEGRPAGEVPPGLWRRWRADAGFRPPGGESLADVGARVRQACQQLAEDGRDTVVVSHVSPIKAAVAWALGAPESAAWRMHLSLGAICRLELGAEGPVLWRFNDTSHLAGLPEP